MLRTCRVSFQSPSGIKHYVEIEAESVFEAAVSGVKAISQEWADEPGFDTHINVEIAAPTVRHQVTIRQIQHWLEEARPNPKEKVLRERVRAAFDSNRV